MTRKNYVPYENPEDELDARLADIASGQSFITTMQKKKKIKPKVDDMSFEAELNRNWWIYVLLALSAVFTGTLGFFMGLAPYATAEGIYFNNDILHIFLAIAYTVAFIGVTEFAFGLGKWLYFTREQDNTKQGVAMIVWMIAAGVSILFTGIAGGSVIASFISFMTVFSQVSVLSQEWIVKSIPVLFFFYSALGTIYILSSRENAAKRMVKEQQRESDLAHETRLHITKQWGREQVLKAEIKKYMDAVERGVMTMKEAQDGIEKGLSLRDMEKNLRRDLDGDNIVGEPIPVDMRSRSVRTMALDHPQHSDPQNRRP